MITPQNVLRHELIGMDILVSGAANPDQRGLSGRVIDETKNLLVIETQKGVRRIQKMHSIFRVRLQGGEIVEIDGSVMVLAPEKRINLHEKKRIP
ncbi:ribonuclease P protein subunit [Methanoregula sp.]|uniref:ribonuclease P protein component 1 n=1 Tax=Methanoregula sp. TaxID=2052170 RepID=UPI002639D289|nr:ribonuclease P protein subunit [Methanoregula sp.]MDD5143232.1 ribonuclease P protein subunit [Methanoregula sp.]